MEHEGRPVIWQISYPEPIATPLQSYTLTSAGDVPTRDPQHWTLSGSNDGQNWIELDQRDLEGPFAERHMAQSFEFTNNKPFKSYRFVFQHADKSHFQVAEIALGTPKSAYRTISERAQFAGPYRRELDMDRAVHHTRYTREETTYERSYFCSYPAQVMVLRLTADKQGAYTGTIKWTDAHRGQVSARREPDHLFRLAGRVCLCRRQHAGPHRQVRTSHSTMKLSCWYSTKAARLTAVDGAIRFQGCDALTVLVAAGTDYCNQREKGWKTEHPHQRITAQLAAAAAKPYEHVVG